jgi:hypothetical protein
MEESLSSYLPIRAGLEMRERKGGPVQICHRVWTFDNPEKRGEIRSQLLWRLVR